MAKPAIAFPQRETTLPSVMIVKSRVQSGFCFVSKPYSSRAAGMPCRASAPFV